MKTTAVRREYSLVRSRQVWHGINWDERRKDIIKGGCNLYLDS